jgi:hypothetical protein
LALGLALLTFSPQAAASVAGCAGAQRTLAAASVYTEYDDDIEDAGDAPDFCGSEVITNDNQAVTIGIHVHNRSRFEEADNYAILLDTDRNPATGQPATGADYELGFNGGGVQLSRWEAASFEQLPAAVSMTWIDGYGPALTFRRSDIGDPAGFAIVFVSSDGSSADRAPDVGSWAYAVTPLQLRVRALSLGVARAGRAFTASVQVIRNDWDAALAEGRIDCAATVAGRSLTGLGRFAHNRVACTWRLPVSSRGKQLSARITATLQGARASRAFSIPVR